MLHLDLRSIGARYEVSLYLVEYINEDFKEHDVGQVLKIKGGVYYYDDISLVTLKMKEVL